MLLYRQRPIHQLVLILLPQLLNSVTYAYAFAKSPGVYIGILLAHRMWRCNYIDSSQLSIGNETALPFPMTPGRTNHLTTKLRLPPMEKVTNVATNQQQETR